MKLKGSEGLENVVRYTDQLNMVTGAPAYTGRYITELLLNIGERVRTLTGHPEKNPFGKRVVAFPYNFDKQEELVDSMGGVDTFYITYWVRFPYKEMTYDKAVENSKILIRSAQKAGVKRIVHISITNADEESPFPYFKGKGTVERLIRESGISYAILRPTLLFGKESKEGILINNIAYLLRKLPIFAIPGDGNYKVQPIYVEDLAQLAVDAAHKNKNITVDAAGPETHTFNELVELIRYEVGSHPKIHHLPPWLFIASSWSVGKLLNDIVVTRDEVRALMEGLLYSKDTLTGKTEFSSWLKNNKESIGTKYISEVKTHFV